MRTLILCMFYGNLTCVIADKENFFGWAFNSSIKSSVKNSLQAVRALKWTLKWFYILNFKIFPAHVDFWKQNFSPFCFEHYVYFFANAANFFPLRFIFSRSWCTYTSIAYTVVFAWEQLVSRHCLLPVRRQPKNKFVNPTG